MMALHVAAATVVLASQTAADTPPPIRTEVTDLPGFGKPPSRMYTGFSQGGVPPSGVGTSYFHYIMYEAEESPETAPSVVWYNGGPGSPSAFGMFQELGPLYINDDSVLTEEYNKTGIPTPIRNPFTWSSRFNLFAVDSPAPVGFSYCSEEGPSGDGRSCGPWNDNSVFTANRDVLVNLFNKAFPELLKNDLFIAGESYAGVYVPGIVNEILNTPNKGGLNLKGYAVGDGCMASPPVNSEKCHGPVYDIEFFGGHGARFPTEIYTEDAIWFPTPAHLKRAGV
jgi:cathepsin A (carboxypeptidase C)